MAAPVSGSNPYIGPRAFETGERLYGREREANQLVNLIIAERIVLLHSPSGAGKTSLIQAALIPKLSKLKFRVLPVIRVNLDPSGSVNGNTEWNRYVFSTLLSLEEGLPAAQRAAADRLAQMTLSDYLAQWPRPEGGPDIEVLIFDQFEEILTLHPTDQAAKHEFFNQLGEALAISKRWALFSMREDYVAALDPYRLPVPSRFGNTFRLDLLGQEPARQAIQQPARQAGVEFTDAAAERLVDDLRRVRVQQPDGTLEPQLGPYVEPLQLQVVCYRLWEALRPNPLQITEQDLAAARQVDQSLVDRSLAEYYAQRVAAAAAEIGISERSIREWFDRQLITEQGARDTVLMGKERSSELSNRAIRLLVDAYLVRGEKRGGATWFELSHDRLIGPVRANNAAWFKANLSLLQQRAELWNQRGRPESLLLRGQELAQARQWAADHRAGLLPAEVDFLARSQAQAARALRRLLAVVSVGILLLAATTITFVAWREAQRQARVAHSSQLVAQSRADLEQSPPRSMLLAIEALKATSSADEWHQAAAEEALRAALEDPHGLPLGGHEGSVGVVAFSPAPPEGSTAGYWLATGSADNTARLWPMGTADPAAHPLVLRGHMKPITALAFSPDRRWLATGSEDGTVRMWDLRAPDPSANPTVLDGHGDDVYAMAFSPDGHWLATGGLDGKIRLWDMTASNPAGNPLVLAGHEDMIRVLAFSPAPPDGGTGGRWLASGSDDSTVRLWDMSSGNPAANPRVLPGHEASIRALAFSPDGHWLASGSRDSTARIWDLHASSPAADPIVLRGHQDWVNTLAFSPDGHWLATGSGDKTARLWDLHAADPAAHPILLHGHQAWINSLAFSPALTDGGTGGQWLATGSGDGTARLWNLEAADPSADAVVLRGHEDQVTSLAFSPVSRDGGGYWLATGSQDMTARLWVVGAADPATDPLVLRGNRNQVNAVAFSPAAPAGGTDGPWLAAGGGDPAKDGAENDNAVRLWNLGAANPAEDPRILNGHANWIQTLAFSPLLSANGTGGPLLATGSGDGTARLWNLGAANPAAESKSLLGHTDFVWTLAFSPDGRQLATGSQDATVRLWDLTAADPAANPVILRGHEDRVTALAFSPDGRWLATGSLDQTVRLWDLNSADPAANPIRLVGHQDAITALAFSPAPPEGGTGGRWLATGSRDNTIRLWDLSAADPAANPKILSGHGDWVNALAFSPDERWLATGSRDSTARLWDLHSPDPARSPLVLSGHSGPVTTLAFSPAPPNGGTGGRWLATGSEDKTILLWDMLARQLPGSPVTLRGRGDAITSLAFSPAQAKGGTGGDWLAAGSKDGTVQLWRLSLDELISMACRSAGRNLRQEGNLSQLEWQRFFPGETYHKTCPQWPEGR